MMVSLVWLLPLSLAMGMIGLLAFLWTLDNKQYEDLDGAAERILDLEYDKSPLPDIRAQDCSHKVLDDNREILDVKSTARG